jgi:hypothetical protein
MYIGSVILHFLSRDLDISILTDGIPDSMEAKRRHLMEAFLRGWEKAACEDNIRAGFQKCGIYPLKPEILKAKPNHLFTRHEEKLVGPAEQWRELLGDPRGSGGISVDILNSIGTHKSRRRGSKFRLARDRFRLARFARCSTTLSGSSLADWHARFRFSLLCRTPRKAGSSHSI